MPELESLVRRDPREVWPNEAGHFTPWLADHLDKLGEVLGMELELVQRECDAGDFSIDILARDLGQQRKVVIENQLEMTDHGHLGQAITYAAAADAGVVVWVCREFRDEHRAALDWLNRGLGATTEFFGVVLEVLQIDTSRPAVNFRVVAAPAGRSLRRARLADEGVTSERGLLYQAFFQRLLDELREKHRFTNARLGRPQNWYSFTTGVTGFSYAAAFKKARRLGVEIYIDFEDEDQNLAALRLLRADSAEIDSAVGATLCWEELEHRRACRVVLYRDGAITDPQDRLDEYLAWTIEKLLAFRAAFGPRLARIAERLATAASPA